MTFETRGGLHSHTFLSGESLSSRRCEGKPYREIAEGLTSRNIPMPRGGDAWNAMSVRRAMKRLRIAGK